MIVRERIEFERGKDPKETMRIGIASNSIPIKKVMAFYHTDNSLRPQPGHSILKDLEDRKIRRYTGDFRFITEDGETLYPDDIFGNYVEFEGEFYDLTNTKYPIKEAIEFERGKDPKEIMRIGMGPDFHNLDKFAKKLGFKRVKEDYPIIVDDPIPGTKILMLWEHPEGHTIQYMYTLTSYYRGSTATDPKTYVVEFSNADGGGLEQDLEWGIDEDKIRNEVFKIYESIRFERGKDPKDALDVGLRVFDVDGMGLQQDEGFSFEPKDVIEVLNSPELWFKEPFRSLLLNQLIPPTGHKSYSLMYLAEGPGEYDYVRYQGELYPIPNPKNRITESVSFERGKDPRDIMSIGDKEARIIKKLNKVLSPRGFVQTSLDMEEEPHLRDIVQWRSPENVVVYLYQNNEREDEDDWDYGVSVVDNDNMKTLADMREDDFDQEWVWDNILRGDPMHYRGIKESVSFQKGKDPRDAMDIGDNQAKIERELKKVTDFFNEPWLEEIIPDYAKELAEMGVKVIDLNPMVYKVIYEPQKPMVEATWITSEGREIIDHTKVPKKPNSKGEFSKNAGINILYSLIDNIKWYEHELMK